MLQSFDFSSIYTHPPQADIAHAFDEAAARIEAKVSASSGGVLKAIRFDIVNGPVLEYVASYTKPAPQSN